MGHTTGSVRVTPAPAGKPGVGVLDIQGGVIEHLGHLAQLGVQARRVRHPADLAGLQALILPGGESTCMARLLHMTGLDAAIRQHYDEGLRLWGTCAGAILLATDLQDEASHLSLIQMTIRRNAFGPQLESFTETLSVPGVVDEPIRLIFIRAPMIVSVGPDVEVLLRVRDSVAAARSGRILVTAFHPELSGSLAFHRFFLESAGVLPSTRASGSGRAAVSTWPYADRGLRDHLDAPGQAVR